MYERLSNDRSNQSLGSQLQAQEGLLERLWEATASAGPLPYHKRLTDMIPNGYRPIEQYISKYFVSIDEERCAELYEICKDYNQEEVYVLFSALREELGKLRGGGSIFNKDKEKARAHKLSICAAYAAPVIAAYKMEKNEVVASQHLAYTGFNGLMANAGVNFNVARKANAIVELPDVSKEDAEIFRGAVASMLIANWFGVSAELVLYFSAHWRELAPYAQAISEHPNFDIQYAQHLVESGSRPLMDGAL